MSKKNKFLSEITEAYTFKGDSIILGSPKLDGEVLTNTFVKIPLKTLNRHGLIAGATGTGKTKTLQIIIEQLSAKGVPSLVMDIKGDLSGVDVRKTSVNTDFGTTNYILPGEKRPTGYPELDAILLRRSRGPGVA